MLAFVPEELKTITLCQQAVRYSPRIIMYVPVSIQWIVRFAHHVEYELWNTVCENIGLLGLVGLVGFGIGSGIVGKYKNNN